MRLRTIKSKANSKRNPLSSFAQTTRNLLLREAREAKLAEKQKKEREWLAAMPTITVFGSEAGRITFNADSERPFQLSGKESSPKATAKAFKLPEIIKEWRAMHNLRRQQAAEIFGVTFRVWANWERKHSSTPLLTPQLMLFFAILIKTLPRFDRKSGCYQRTTTSQQNSKNGRQTIAVFDSKAGLITFTAGSKKPFKLSGAESTPKVTAQEFKLPELISDWRRIHGFSMRKTAAKFGISSNTWACWEYRHDKEDRRPLFTPQIMQLFTILVKTLPRFNTGK